MKKGIAAAVTGRGSGRWNERARIPRPSRTWTQAQACTPIKPIKKKAHAYIHEYEGRVLPPVDEGGDGCEEYRHVPDDRQAEGRHDPSSHGFHQPRVRHQHIAGDEEAEQVDECAQSSASGHSAGA
jgi:hypothetical protein